jgi:hypothetical protein
MCGNFISDPYPMSGGRIARIRKGQDAPYRSNLVIAWGCVLLPATEDEESIIWRIRFEDKVPPIMGRSLYGWWGEQGEKLKALEFPIPLEGNWRFRFIECSAPTWREAMGSAWEYAHAELMKLEEALALRKRALEEAECSENIGVQAYIKRKIQIATKGE